MCLISFTLFCFDRQRDTTGLSAENAELKIRLQAMEQQAQLRDGEHLFNFFHNKFMWEGVPLSQQPSFILGSLHIFLYSEAVPCVHGQHMVS
jgi:hypothetical protein